MRRFVAVWKLAASTGYRLCIFIDGLDEFEGDFQQQIDLVALLVGASHSPGTKICVSSRSYPVSQDAFVNYPQLRLERYTRRDIQIYITDELSKHPEMGPLLKLHPQPCFELLMEIADRAQGVFI